MSCVIDGKLVYADTKLMDKFLAKEHGRQAAIALEAARERDKAEKERQEAIEKAKWRTWTDSTGTHKTYAKYSGISFGKVKLVKEDGSAVQLPLEKLSGDDREWIANRGK